jgi:hypothetical protein
MLDMKWNVLAKLSHAPAEYVRYRRNSGKHLLVLSFSHFDPSDVEPDKRQASNWRSQSGLELL